ncbi:MAG: altronate dehydratase family protein [Saprospiraceae bacterium]
MTNLPPYLQLHDDDNVLTARIDLPKGTSISWQNTSILLKEDIAAKHKFTVKPLSVGDPVFMYGVLVGKATQAIQEGGLISTKNLTHATQDYSGRKGKIAWTAPDVSRWANKQFMGYHRSDGKVGTANHWIVAPLVFCENRNIKVLESALSDSLGYQSVKKFSVDVSKLVKLYQDGAPASVIQSTAIIQSAEDIRQNRPFPNVDGIKFLTHQGGCGGTREDSEALCHLLAGYITHPNVAGATILSLGCQNAEDTYLMKAIRERDPNFNKPLVMLEQQKSLSERGFIEEAVKQTFLGLIQANQLQREPAPLNKLVLGLECGGSDGFSGISANPALGHTSDLLVALGGTTILSEFPELNGVEQELINRCENDQIAQKFMAIMKAYSDRAEAVGSGFKNNPSPGNIRDGLITDAIKSAGAAKKGGTSPVTDVLDYTEPASKPGLNLLCTPGNDVESTTGLAASGANLIVFTTGLGTPTGNPITPVVKVSTNNRLFQQMGDIIDINAGTIISGEDSIASKGEELLDYLIKVASGEAIPAAVRLKQDDFIPWKRGISL